MPGTFDNTAGKLSLTGAFFFYVFPPVPTTSGPGTLATVTFEVAGYGDSDITIGDETRLRVCTNPMDPETIIDIIDASANPEQIGDGFFSNWMGGAPPVASFTYTPVTPEVDDVVTFDASTSYDPDGFIVGYYWEFGNGDTSSAMVATTVYDAQGLYTARLTVTDNASAQDLATATIEVIGRKAGVALVDWQARIEHRRYDMSKDEDAVNTIWAVAGNTLNLSDVELTVEFAITDYYTHDPVATYSVTETIPANTELYLLTMEEWAPTVGKYMVRITGYYDSETTKTKRITTRCVP
jgi:PKD repeat protein